MLRAHLDNPDTIGSAFCSCTDSPPLLGMCLKVNDLQKDLEAEGGSATVYREDSSGKGGVACFRRAENVEDLKSDFTNMSGPPARVSCCDGTGIIMSFSREVTTLGFTQDSKHGIRALGRRSECVGIVIVLEWAVLSGSGSRGRDVRDLDRCLDFAVRRGGGSEVDGVVVLRGNNVLEVESC